MLNLTSNEEIESILQSTDRSKKALKSKDHNSEVIESFNNAAKEEVHNTLRANMLKFKERPDLTRQEKYGLEYLKSNKKAGPLEIHSMTFFKELYTDDLLYNDELDDPNDPALYE